MTEYKICSTASFCSELAEKMKPPLMKLWTADFMKPTSFRVSLQYNILRYKNGQINWFDKISENLYLGAIPLKSSSTDGSQGRLGDVPKKLPELNIKAVISCNEEFERVVTPSVAEWEKLGIQQYKVSNLTASKISEG